MEQTAYQRMAAEEENHWWYRGRRTLIARLIGQLNMPKQSARILEVGCGSGGNLALLQRFGHVDAVEPDDQARAAATHKSGLAIAAGALPDAIDMPDHCYDLIGLFDVLEHVDDDIGSLKALTAKLAPSGRILVTVPAHPWLWSKHDVVHHHSQRYTLASLKATIGEAGLRVENLGFFNTILFPLAVAQRLAARFAGTDANVPGWLDALFYHVFALERHVIGKRCLPTGLSLFAIVKVNV